MPATLRPKPKSPSLTQYMRVASHVRQMIERAVLRPGMRIPSVRRTARQQRVSITTVQAAYRLLERDRLIESRPRSGYFVRDPGPRLPAPPASRPPSAPRLISVCERALAVVRTTNAPHLVPLGAAVPGTELLPVKTLSRLTGRVARQFAKDCTAYDALPGCRRFREQVSHRALDAGCVLAPDDLVVTNGAVEALHLALRAVARPGDVVAVESPTFFGALQLLETLGLRALEIATDPGTGVVLDELETALHRHRVAACLFSPNFQNPTGSCMPDENKRRLVRLLADRNVPLIEDDIYGELPFAGPRPRAAKAFDAAGLVLWCSSLSKTLAPGLRAGWIAPGRFRADVERLKAVHSITNAPIPLLVAAEFLETGQFDRHLRAMRATIAHNVQRLTASIADRFPPGTHAAHPLGGMVLWLELPPGCDAMDLQRLALDHNIALAPGPIFSPTHRYHRCIRFNCALHWSDRIDHALSQLGLLARQQLK